MRRDRLLALALVHLGVPPAQAWDIVDYALESDPELGLERGLLAVRAHCRRELAAEARTIREACELIVALSDRCAALEAYVRGMERDAVEPLRGRGYVPPGNDS